MESPRNTHQSDTHRTQDHIQVDQATVEHLWTQIDNVTAALDFLTDLAETTPSTKDLADAVPPVALELQRLIRDLRTQLPRPPD